MSEVTRKIVFLLCFIAIYGTRVYFGRLVKQNKITDDRKTVREKLLLFITVVGMFILPLVNVFTPWLDFAKYDLPNWIGWIGTTIFAVAIWLFWRTHTDLGLNWSASLQIRENHFIVDTGVYRYVRHPMYAAFWFWGIAQALLLHNWISGLSYMVSFLPMYLWRVHQEEQMMLDTFGEQYRDYILRTGRVIPKLSNPVVLLK
jgi:protein-S-isoprenylcysteine O-methyltransferase Ste14